MVYIVRLSLFVCVLALAACGFSPLYGSAGGSGQATMAQIAIEPIPDRDGQALRNALIDRFYRSGRPKAPRYALVVAPVIENRIDLDETVQSDTTRQQLRLETTMILRDLSSGETVLTRKLRAIASYNVLSSEYTTRVSRGAVRENALNDLARQIETHVSLFLSGRAL